MIDVISLPDEYCFKPGQKISGLKEVNFFFGENGAGKSTIAKTIQKGLLDNSSAIVSTEPESFYPFVFNQSYIEEVVKDTSVDGIIVLGEGAPKLQDELNDLFKQQESITARIVGRNNTLEEKYKEIGEAEEEVLTPFLESLRSDYREEFNPAFKGYLKDIVAFKNKLQKFLTPELEPKSYEQLAYDAEIFFSKDKPEPLELLPALRYLNCKNIHEQEVFQRSIKGKAETSVAELIEHLGCSDWVAEGVPFFKDDVCPFCQRKTDEHFLEQLESYFDRTWKEEKKIFEDAKFEYQTATNALLTHITNYGFRESRYFSFDSIRTLYEQIESIIKNNVLLLEKKQKELSVSIDLLSLSPLITQLEEYLSGVNEKLRDYNGKVSGLKEGKTQLINEVWEFLAAQAAASFDSYNQRIIPMQRAIVNLTEGNKNDTITLKLLASNVQRIKNKLKGIDQPADEINKTLTAFGFNNFTLKPVSEEGSYRIIRKGGEDAGATLSEGEKNFIAFLYFYHSTRGVGKDTGEPIEKVLVIDDPVSSLDARTMLAISSLTRELIAERSTHHIKQIFVLSHNAQAFREVTQNIRAMSADKKCTFWYLSKQKEGSSVTFCERNPIESSYQMLWNEYRAALIENDPNLQNIMRRIIESYFTMLGGVDKLALLDPLNDEEKIIGRCLIHWCNAGSHRVCEELCFHNPPDLLSKYIKVFQSIFESNGQKGHYDMMMKQAEQEEKLLAS